MGEVKISGFVCERCSHKWTSRLNKKLQVQNHLPIVCPSCKSPYWNIPRNNKKGER